MNSILNTEVSCFANYDTPHNPKAVNLLSWLKSEKYRAQVEAIRSTPSKAERDKLKAILPAITPSGTFTYRSVSCLIRHSNLLQFDIDLKGNEHLNNYKHLLSQIIKIKNVAYCGLSVSGRGYWGLIPIAYPEKHAAHFAALEEVFRSFGITLDPAPKSVASLRGYSFDPDAYFNHEAVIFERLIEPPVQSEVNYRTPNSFNASKIYETAGNLIEAAPDGQKWLYLSKASYLLGGYAGAGLIESQEALTFLKTKIEARKDVKSLTKAYKTIEKCFAEGRKHPLFI